MTPSSFPARLLTGNRCLTAISRIVNAMMAACSGCIGQIRLLAFAVRHPDFLYVIQWRKP